MHNGNWIAISRMILDHYVVGAAQPMKPRDPKKGAYSKLEAWLWLLCNASYEARTVLNRGRETRLDPGQLMGARAYLAEQWNWSEKQVRTFLKRLEMTDQIASYCSRIRGQQKGNQANIITIRNWDRFQLSAPQQRPPERPAKGQQRASEGPQSNKETNKQVNNNPTASQTGRGDSNGPAQDDWAAVLAGWIDPNFPRIAEARMALQGFSNSYGRENVIKALTDLAAKRANGEIITNPTRLLRVFCEHFHKIENQQNPADAESERRRAEARERIARRERLING